MKDQWATIRQFQLYKFSRQEWEEEKKKFTLPIPVKFLDKHIVEISFGLIYLEHGLAPVLSTKEKCESNLKIV